MTIQRFRDRDELLRSGFLPHGAVCAEVGVCEGVFSEMIARLTSPKRLHLIDVWAGIGACGAQSTSDELSLTRLGQVSKMFQPGIKSGRVLLHQGLSVEVMRLFPPGYFDWLYLDADHSYLGLLGDLLAAEPKVSGLIAGHDIVMPAEAGGVLHHFPGVKRAVDDFCRFRDWEMVALTAVGPDEDPDRAGRNSPSYVLKRKEG